MRDSNGGGAYSGSLNSSYSDSATAMVVSNPMRSASASGPIGWAQPSTMPWSMSSALANPDSNMRMADSRYGMRRALTMKPARSWERMARLSSTSSTNRSARVEVAVLVSSDGTSS